MLCKKALEENGGSEEKAVEWLRKQGIKTADKKSVRNTKAGIVEAYVHGLNLGVLVELRCETDFVAKNPEFKELAHSIAMHVAAMSPLGVKPEDVPEEIVKKEMEIYKAEVEKMGKPANIAEQIAKGKLEKFYQDNCLLKQQYVKAPDKTVESIINEKIQKFGEKIEVGGFARMSLQ